MKELKKKYFKCSHCGKTFIYDDKELVYMMVDKNKPYIYCPNCNTRNELMNYSSGYSVQHDDGVILTSLEDSSEKREKVSVYIQDKNLIK